MHDNGGGTERVDQVACHGFSKVWIQNSSTNNSESSIYRPRNFEYGLTRFFDVQDNSKYKHDAPASGFAVSNHTLPRLRVLPVLLVFTGSLHIGKTIGLAKNFADDSCGLDTGQLQIQTLKFLREAFVLDTKKMQHRSVQIVNRDDILHAAVA